MKIFFAQFFALILLVGSAVAADPELTKARLDTVTGDDNKDHDTCVWATVMTADGSAQLAHITNGDCGGDDATEYNDRSYHFIEMTLDAAGASKETCRAFKVHMWQKTHGGRGHDTWKFDATVILFFSDGLNFVAKRNGVVLTSKSTNDSPSVDFAHQ